MVRTGDRRRRGSQAYVRKRDDARDAEATIWDNIAVTHSEFRLTRNNG